jgi:hypothetical protein
VEYAFERYWRTADYAEYLKGEAQRLSFANLSADPVKFKGWLVGFSGVVQDVSQAEEGGRTYLRMTTSTKKVPEEVVFVSDSAVLFKAGQAIRCYGTVTGETFPFPVPDAGAEGAVIDLPALDYVLGIGD